MKIVREINGQPIEFVLTNDELFSAYLEKEHEYDCQDVQEELENYNFNDESRKDFVEIFGVPFGKVFGNEELLHEIAYEKRHNQDHYGMYWNNARDDALKDVLAEYKKTLASENISLLQNEAVAFQYKGIVFDEWMIDDETGGVYGEMCECCGEKYKDLFKDELSEGGIGACSVKGCDVVGADADTITHFYVDFKPELIRPLSKEQVFVLEGHASLDDKIADAQTQLCSSSDNCIAEACSRVENVNPRTKNNKKIKER